MINYCEQAVAICDKWVEGFERQKTALNNPNFTYYTNFDRFIRHDMDAFVLANYAAEHAPFAIRAMKVGKHVFSEVLPLQTMKEYDRLTTCSAVGLESGTMADRRRRVGAKSGLFGIEMVTLENSEIKKASTASFTKTPFSTPFTAHTYEWNPREDTSEGVDRIYVNTDQPQRELRTYKPAENRSKKAPRSGTADRASIPCTILYRRFSAMRIRTRLTYMKRWICSCTVWLHTVPF